MDAKQANESSCGVIFDLDGTLVDTLDDITNSLNDAFTMFDYPALSRDRARLLIGEGLVTLLQRASGETDPKRVESLVRQYRAIYRDRMFERSSLYPGVADMLDRVADSGHAMAVLSNKPDDFTVPIGEHLLSRWPFKMIRGAKPDVPRKPDPTSALELCAMMGTAPGDTTIVGDSDVDIQTAHNAGMGSIAVTWGFRDRPSLERAKPDVVYKYPGDVADYLLGLPCGQSSSM